MWEREIRENRCDWLTTGETGKEEEINKNGTETGQGWERGINERKTNDKEKQCPSSLTSFFQRPPPSLPSH
jgi:hypothetical protein